MCGIVGVLNLNDAPVAPPLLRTLLATLAHRGPDGLGVHVDGHVGLGHARLSIIDLPGGRQPMHNEDRSLWITFNGEIFNYLELRDGLLRRGHRFSSNSDTEVILHLYEERGSECVHEFNGQWSFAIWDATRRHLFLSRDRMGVRPLFYTVSNGTFLFASEIKALLAAPFVSRELDACALTQLFTFWTTLPPRTVFKDVLELPPGHSLLVEPHRIRTYRYWRLTYPPMEQFAQAAARPEQDYADELVALLGDATRLRLRSDVPVGAYLSGGLDSSVVTTFAARCTAGPLRTYSLTFDDADLDESAHQIRIVKFLRTDHRSLRCSYRDIGEVFPEVIWHTEKPLLWTGPAPLFLLSSLVHDDGLKVVLTGEGADELFGGYDIFKEAKIRRLWLSRPESRLVPLLLARLHPDLRPALARSSQELKASFYANPEFAQHPFFAHLPRWTLGARLRQLLSRRLREALASYDEYEELRSLLPADYWRWHELCRAQYFETVYLLPGYILSSLGDRVAMAHAVEGRFPFLDYRIVSFAAGLPMKLKIRGLTEKYVLKRAARTLVPAETIGRTKQPYRGPLVRMFFDDNLRRARFAYVDEFLSYERIIRDDLFDVRSVQALLGRLTGGHGLTLGEQRALIGVLSTELLVHRFIVQGCRMVA